MSKFEGLKGRHFYGRPRAALSLATPLGGKHTALTLSLSQLKQCSSEAYAWVRILRENLLIVLSLIKFLCIFRPRSPSKFFHCPGKTEIPGWGRTGTGVPADALASPICVMKKVQTLLVIFSASNFHVKWRLLVSFSCEVVRLEVANSYS